MLDRKVVFWLRVLFLLDATLEFVPMIAVNLFQKSCCFYFFLLKRYLRYFAPCSYRGSPSRESYIDLHNCPCCSSKVGGLMLVTSSWLISIPHSVQLMNQFRMVPLIYGIILMTMAIHKMIQWNKYSQSSRITSSKLVRVLIQDQVMYFFLYVFLIALSTSTVHAYWMKSGFIYAE